MPRLVTGPDGKSWPFPDDASDAEILQFMEENTQRSSEISDIGEVTIGQKAKLMAQSAAEHTPDALKVAPVALGTRLLDTALGAIQAVPNELLGLHDPLTGKGLLRLGGEQAISALGGPSPGEQQAFKAKAPAAAGIGEGLGDILTVFAARRGGTKGLQNLPAAVGLGPPTLPAKTLKAAIEAAQPGARRFALEAADNVRSALGNLSKRVALASGEGAAFSALQDEDLSIGATAGAGLELATAPVRAISSFAVSNPLKALVTAGGAALIIPQFIPGGSDKVLDSITKGGDEVALAIGLGIPISLATRRFNKKGSIARNFPEMTGLMEALPRGALTQVISSWMRSPDTVGPVIEKFGTDPALFGEFTRELGDAMASGNAGALGKTVKRLQKDVKFRQILNDSEDNVIGDFVGP